VCIDKDLTNTKYLLIEIWQVLRHAWIGEHFDFQLERFLFNFKSISNLLTLHNKVEKTGLFLNVENTNVYCINIENANIDDKSKSKPLRSIAWTSKTLTSILWTSKTLTSIAQMTNVFLLLTIMSFSYTM
jgi:hypothetical protein